jgi:hypothetical protein
MEQIDRISLFSEIFWIILVFILFYFWILSSFIPKVYTSIKLRIYIKNIYRIRVKSIYKMLLLIKFFFRSLIKEKIKIRSLLNYLLYKMSNSKIF